MTRKILLGLLLAISSFAYAENKLEVRERDNTFDGFIDENNVWQGVGINGNAATATAGAADGANCSAGSAPLGVGTDWAAQGCFDVETDAEASSHEGNASAHHTATVDTNAGTICSGTGNYLDGEGNCDALVTDTGSPHGNGTNCSAGNSPLGVDASGAVEGCFDVETGAEATSHEGNASAHHTATVDTNTNAETICSGTDVFLDGEGNCDTLSTGAHTVDTGPSPDCSGTTTYQDGEGNCDDLDNAYQAVNSVLDRFQLAAITATICTTVPTAAGYVAISTDEFDFFNSTGSLIGQWRNSRTGAGACN